MQGAVDDGRPSDALNQGWQGRRVAIRPVTHADHPFLYELCLDENVAHRWRFRGHFPDPAEFVKSLGQGVLVQFLAVSRDSGAPIGLVTTYNANQREGWGYIASIAHASAVGTGDVVEAVELVIDYLFRVWPFRKLYFETLEFNIHQFLVSPHRILHLEGCLRHHVFYDGQYWDLMTYAIYRSDWSRYRKRRNSASFSSDVLSLDQFVEAVRLELRISDGSVKLAPETLLLELGVDSISMVELAEFIEQLTGVDLVPKQPLETIRDLYSLYCSAASSPTTPMAGWGNAGGHG